ncbi:MAG: hypothetical protein UHK60_08045 [Acutalibacteraceae bacterium]|nr:hypothetical protein [Acutalibacteraceae bacterium]
MAKLSYFNRHAKLILKFYNQENLILPFKTVTYEHYISLNNTKIYNNTRISFEVEKYPSKGLDYNGTAKILIYNISDDINDLLANESLVKKLELQVGYGDKIETIYKGTINTSYVSYAHNDMITYMWCFSFSSVLLGKDYQKSYSFKMPQTYKGMLNLILSDISLILQENISVDTSYMDKETEFNFGSGLFQNVTVDGLRGMLDRISKDLSCDYYIEDNKIYLGSFKDEKKLGLVELSPQNGLLNNPNVTDSGLEIKTILNPKIKMFTPIKVMSDFADYSGSGYNFTDATKRINANYLMGFKSFYSNSQAVYVSHKGDTHENTWETNVTTVTLNETINPKAIKAL